MGSTVRRDWSELTNECLLDIFSRLSMGQRWNGPMLVCKNWMNICQDQSLNTILDLEAEFVSSPDSFSPICQDLSLKTILDLKAECLSSPESFYWWSPEFEEKVDSTIRSAVDQSHGGLKEVRVRHCTNRSLSYVAERCPNLEVLSVKYSPKVTVESMRKIALNCSKLIELDISCSYEISCECIALVGANCKNLQILKRNLMHPFEVERVRHCTYAQNLSFMTLGNVDAYIIGRNMRQLKHLELRYSTLTDRGLAHLCKECSDLEYLDLLGCRDLTTEGITNHSSSLKNLKEIKRPNFTDLL